MFCLHTFCNLKLFLFYCAFSASILSKKAAEGVKHLVLDLKCGNGCWLDTVEKAQEAANDFKKIATGLGITCICMITNMDTPLGFCVGNALEIEESIDFLKKNKARAQDLKEIVVAQGILKIKYPFQSNLMSLNTQTLNS